MTTRRHQLTVIITVFNEEQTITRLLDSLSHQILQPAEVIFTDGGSTDRTVQLIKTWSKKQSFPVSVYSQKLNRSQGRNLGIAKAKFNWIAITDAGCIPHRNWLHQLVRPLLEKKSLNSEYEIIAGYYDSAAQNNFEEAVVPYVLVMPERVNPNDFLPSTRSVLFHKKVWELGGGFDESLELSEDLEFFRRIKKQLPQVKFIFSENAKVSWLPRQNLVEFWQMIHSLAAGDIKAHIYRPKVGLIFGRYGLAIILIGLGLWFQFSFKWLLTLGVFGLILYSAWATKKNIKYVPHGWYWLPILQIVADMAVMSGTVVGFSKR